MTCTAIALLPEPGEPGPTDASVLREMQAGDNHRFPFIHNKYHPRLHAMFAAKLKDANLAEELEQRTWVAFLDRLRELDPERDLLAWLRGIGRVEFAAYWRKVLKLTLVRLPEDSGPVPAPLTRSGPEEDWAARRRAEALAWAMGSLPKPDQALLRARDVEGLSYAELERRTGRNQRTLQCRVTRLHRRARAYLDEYYRLARAWDGHAVETPGSAD